MEQISIILADDHPAYSAGIRAGIEKEDDMVVVGEANNGRDALRLARELEPGVLLLDMQLPIISGLRVARQLHDEASPVLVMPLSGFSDPEYVFGVLENGAAGYMTKDESINDIINAVRRVARGGVYVSPRVAIEVVNEQRRRKRTASELEKTRSRIAELGITPPLLKVMKLVAEGHNNRTISEIVCRSEHTIRNQVDKLKSLTGVQWRPALVAWSWKNDVLHMIEDGETERSQGAESALEDR